MQRVSHSFSTARRAPRRLLVFAISVYRTLVSPMLPAACRFHPTCSQYAREAIETHGALAGSLMAFKRVCRCHPFHPGGDDPVP
jgi:hypothetical protein